MNEYRSHLRGAKESQAAPDNPEHVKLPGRRERRRAETRERIYRAALRLFAERGFFETTTEQITEAADVGQGTFFNYFPSKQHVFAVLSEIQLTRARAAREEALTGKSSIQDILSRGMHEIVKEPTQSQALTRSLFSAVMSSETVRTIIGETMAQGRKELAVIMEIGQCRGELRLDGNPGDLALAFQRGVAGTMLLWTMQPRANLKNWLDKTFADFWAGASTTKGQVR